MPAHAASARRFIVGCLSGISLTSRTWWSGRRLALYRARCFAVRRTLEFPLSRFQRERVARDSCRDSARGRQAIRLFTPIDIMSIDSLDVPLRRYLGRSLAV